MKLRLCIVLSVAVILAAAQGSAAPKKRNSHSSKKILAQDLVFSAPLDSEKQIFCIFSKEKIQPIKRKGAKRYSRLSLDMKKRIKKLRARLKKDDFSPSQKKKTKARIEAEIGNYKYKTKMCTEQYAILTRPPCELVLADAVYTLPENAELPIKPRHTSSCDKEVAYKIVKGPVLGEAESLPSGILYRSGFLPGQDTLQAIVCTAQNECSNVADISIEVTHKEFSGKPGSLEPYRDEITFNEAAHLLRKIALNDLHLLEPRQERYSLKELLSRIFDPDSVAPDLKRTLEIFRDGREDGYGSKDLFYNDVFDRSETFESVEAQKEGLLRYLDRVIRSKNNVQNRARLSGERVVSHFYARTRYLSALQAAVAHFWFAHFGTRIGGGSDEAELHGIEYLDLIYDKGLGSFRDLILGQNPWFCLESGEGCGMLANSASAAWLDQHLNTKADHNQNFARELLELYLLGPWDYVRNAENYNEADVDASTAFTSGFRFQEYQAPLGYGGPDPTSLITREKLVWDPSLHNEGRFPAFKGTDFSFDQSATPVEWVTHILDKHPGPANFIAGKLFRMFADPDVAHESVEELAGYLRQSNYDVSAMLWLLASSQAMFSERTAEPSCVLEPYKVFSEAIRNLSVPYFSTVNMRHSISKGVFSELMDFYVSDAGEEVLRYETVFTHAYCGREPGIGGEEWLYPVFLIKRITGMINRFREMAENNRPYWTFASLVREIQERFGTQDITKVQVVEFFSEKFGVNLADNEKEVLYEFLSKKDASGGLLEEDEWSWDNKELMNKKMAGMAAIMASISASNVR